MRPRLLLSLSLLVLAPLVALGWLSARMVADQRQAVAARFDAVIAARLAEAADRVGRVMSDRARGLSAALAQTPATPEAIRAWLARQTAFAQVLVLDPEGAVTFPPLEGGRSEAERAFLERTHGLWAGRALSPQAAPAGQAAPAPPPGPSQRAPSKRAPSKRAPSKRAPQQASGWLRRGSSRAAPAPAAPAPAPSLADPPEAPSPRPIAQDGWHIWYWGGGLNLMFWRRLPDGRLAAAELDRVSLLADVVAALPATVDGALERTLLLDSAGRTIYQWGEGALGPTSRPSHQEPLPPPLSAWRLARHGPGPPSVSAGPGLALGLGAAALALIGLAVWFARESTRALREASQRVTFVNQVSHELKTPLTNIRLYAELLEEEVSDDDPKTRRHVEIIASESQRLSRLIANILSFARQARDTLQIRPVPARLDDVVSDTLSGFGPALAAAGVLVDRHSDAPERALIDPDAVGQIIANLLSNVEKYAPGAPLRLETHRHGDQVRLVLHDGGPGIPAAEARRVFEPFYRLSNALTDAAQGTGIGLGLARELALRHGGDLVLTPTPAGARFELSLHAPLVAPEPPCETPRETP